MPALEIMPQCASVANIDKAALTRRRGITADPLPREDDTVTSSSLATTDTRDSEMQLSRHEASSKLVRFMKRKLRKFKHRISDYKRSKGTNQSPTFPAGEPMLALPTEKAETGDYSNIEAESSLTSFSSIAVRYMPKIQEDEEEEPPEQFIDTE